MPLIYLIEGPVGAGKSTYSTKLCSELPAVHLNLDNWMVGLFRADRPGTGVMEWYVERKARCVKQMWLLAKDIATAGGTVVLELGLIRRKDREHIYTLADATGLALQVIVLDAARDIRRERVLQRNQLKGSTFSMEVPLPFFEMASDLWEAPDEDEIRSRQILCIDMDIDDASVNHAAVNPA